MAGFRWKPLDQYVPWVRALVQFMWQHTPAPMQPAEFAATARIPRQMLSRWLAAGPEMALAPDPTAVRGAARTMGMPTSALMALVGYGSPADPFLDREEAVHWVRNAVLNTHDDVVGAEERAHVVRVLDAVMDELRAHAAQDAEDTDTAESADATDRVERAETAERAQVHAPDGKLHEVVVTGVNPDATRPQTNESK